MIKLKFTLRCFLALLVLGLTAPLFSAHAAGGSISSTPKYDYAGNINFLSIGASHRFYDDYSFYGVPYNTGWWYSCALFDSANPSNSSSSASLATAMQNPNDIVNLGLPVGSTVLAAHLYWVGSYASLAKDSYSNLTAPDSQVVFNGNTINATSMFTENFVGGGYSLDFFTGYANVTSIVAAAGNTFYTLTGLNTNNGTNTGWNGNIWYSPHCQSRTVVSAWALHVIYSNPAEPLRVINVYDGLRFFQNSNFNLNPSNFQVPAAAIDGKLGVTTWEGDIMLTGSENLAIDGNALTDALNPAGAQYNSSINTTNPTRTAGTSAAPNTSHGVDINTFDISPFLTAGQTSATLNYASGADLVLLSVEIFSTRNIPVVDLVMAKSHVGDFVVDGTNATYALTVSNLGPGPEPGVITVTDTVPTGLTYVSAAGTGWTCGFADPYATCTNPGPLAAGNALPDITLTVTPTTVAVPSVTNTAVVSNDGTNFDLIVNNTANDPTNVLMASLTNLKMVSVYSDPINGTTSPTLTIPGAVMEYTMLITNSGAGPVTLDSVFIEDPIPANSALVVADIAGAGSGPVLFIDGATTSALSYTFTSLASATDDVEFSQTAFPGPYLYSGYTPVADGSGVDTTVTAIRINPKGTMAAAAGGNNPSFSLRFRVRVP